MVLYSRDHKEVSVAHKITSPKNRLDFPDGNEAGKTKSQTSFQIDPKRFQQVAMEFFFLNCVTEFSKID